VVQRCYGRDWKHPLRRYEDKVVSLAKPGMVLVDAGCGHDMPLKAALGPGVFYVGLDYTGGIRTNLERIPLRDACADLVVSKSVMEHIERPGVVFGQMARVLKPGAKLVVLTPNFWDVASVGAWLTPNVLHPRVMKWGEGRAEHDTFPTYYRANTEGRLRRLCKEAGLRVEAVEYWGQYPSVLQRWPRLLYVGCKMARVLDRVHALRRLRGWIYLVAVRGPDGGRP
jgi:SAM-dependent methyltransferase